MTCLLSEVWRTSLGGRRHKRRSGVVGSSRCLAGKRWDPSGPLLDRQPSWILVPAFSDSGASLCSGVCELGGPLGSRYVCCRSPPVDPMRSARVLQGLLQPALTARQGCVWTSTMTVCEAPSPRSTSACSCPMSLRSSSSRPRLVSSTVGSTRRSRGTALTIVELRWPSCIRGLF
jgi:hypothetical protein